MVLFSPLSPIKREIFLAVTSNYRALTWSSGPDDKDLLAVAPYDLVWSVLVIERTNRQNQCFRHIFRPHLATPRMANIHTLTSDYVSNWTDTSLFPLTFKPSKKSLTRLK